MRLIVLLHQFQMNESRTMRSRFPITICTIYLGAAITLASMDILAVARAWCVTKPCGFIIFQLASHLWSNSMSLGGGKLDAIAK